LGVEAYNSHHQVWKSGQRSDLAQTISFYGRSLELNAFQSITSSSDHNALVTAVNQFEILHKDLSYPHETATVSVSLFSSAGTTQSSFDIWSLGEYLVSISTIISSSTIDQLTSSTVVDYVHFLIDNNSPILIEFDLSIASER
jgi:hypothetical protein